MQSKKALIICNGDPPIESLLYKLWEISDFRVAADGGANLLHSFNLIPDAIVGDFDSVKSKTKRYFSKSIFVHIREQNTNDADKAVRHCLKRGFNEINLIGADGARQDQFLSNLEILLKYSSKARLILWSKIERMEFILDSWKGYIPIGTTISLLPLFGGAKKVLTSGLEFEINNHAILPGKPPSGVSNIVKSNPVSISVKNGQILLIVQISKKFFNNYFSNQYKNKNWSDNINKY